MFGKQAAADPEHGGTVKPAIGALWQRLSKLQERAQELRIRLLTMRKDLARADRSFRAVKRQRKGSSRPRKPRQ